MAATITKTRSAKTGTYIPTAVDANKAAVDFRLVFYGKNFSDIIWRDGRIQTVRTRDLPKLLAAHSWATDF